MINTRPIGRGQGALKSYRLTPRQHADAVLREAAGIPDGIAAMLHALGGSAVAELTRVTTEKKVIAFGGFVRGWKFKMRGSNTVVVYNDAPYAEFVERGRGPGKMPPQDAIERWCDLKGIPRRAVYPIRRKIGDEGTFPQPVMSSVGFRLWSRRNAAWATVEGIKLVRKDALDKAVRGPK